MPSQQSAGYVLDERQHVSVGQTLEEPRERGLMRDDSDAASLRNKGVIYQFPYERRSRPQTQHMFRHETMPECKRVVPFPAATYRPDQFLTSAESSKVAKQIATLQLPAGFEAVRREA